MTSNRFRIFALVAAMFSAPVFAGPPTTVVLTGVDVIALPYNANRRSAAISNNDSANTYVVAYGAAATASRGIPLSPLQTIFVDSYKGDIHVIGTGNLTVQEVSP